MSRRLNQAKVVVLGGPSVGKSAFVVRYITKRFIGDYEPNTENLYTHPTTTHRGEEVTLTLVDTASHGEPDTLQHHVNTSDAIILMYTITDRASLHEAHSIRATYLGHRDPTDPLIVIANKSDLLLARTVTETEREELASVLDCPSFEISVAESSEGVNTCMDELIRQITREWVKVQSSLAPPGLDAGKRSTLMNMKNALRRRIGRSKSDTF